MDTLNAFSNSTPPPAAPLPFLTGGQKFTLILVILLASAAGGLWWYTKHGTANRPQNHVSEFSIKSGGTVAWFSLSGTEVSPLSGPSVASKILMPNIRETGPVTPGGTYPVLALRFAEDSSGAETAFGTVDANGAFLPIDIRGLFKEGLTSYGANLFAYAAFVPASTTPATGPAAFSAPFATSTGSWEVRMVDLGIATSSPVPVGQGSDPRFLKDGNILAFGNEGVVRIDSTDHSRTIIVPHAPGIVGSYAASPDLSYIAISNLFSDGATTIYALSSDGHQASAIGVVTHRLYPIAFASDDELVGMNGASSTLEAYLIGDSGVISQGTLTVMHSSSSTP